MSCDTNKKYFESQRKAPATLGSELDHDIRGRNNIAIDKSMEGSKTIFYVEDRPYAAPFVSWAWLPDSVEKGLPLDKSALQLSLNVTKGREQVYSLNQSELNISLANPVLPLAEVYDYPVSGVLGDDEAPSLTLTVNDGKTHSHTATLQRPDRYFFGVIAKDPRTATFDELVAACALTEAGQKGQLGSRLPNTITFNAAGQYWFILTPDGWNFQLKTDLFLNPYRTQLGLQQPNPESAFAQAYTVASDNSKSNGTITFSVI